MPEFEIRNYSVYRNFLYVKQMRYLQNSVTVYDKMFFYIALVWWFDEVDIVFIYFRIWNQRDDSKHAVLTPNKHMCKPKLHLIILFTRWIVSLAKFHRGTENYLNFYSIYVHRLFYCASIIGDSGLFTIQWVIWQHSFFINLSLCLSLLWLLPFFAMYRCNKKTDWAQKRLQTSEFLKRKYRT